MFSAAELVLFSGPPACPEAPVMARVFRVEETPDGPPVYELLLGGRCRGQVVKSGPDKLSCRPKVGGAL